MKIQKKHHIRYLLHNILNATIDIRHSKRQFLLYYKCYQMCQLSATYGDRMTGRDIFLEELL